MKKQVLKILKEHQNKKIIVSVSGGVDSLVLFNLLLELKFELVLVHFNHQKRAASKIEADYLKELTDKLNIPFEYFILDIKTDFQNQAHHLRKKHLQEVALKYHTDVIVTAHHLNDLLETILLKIARGSNLLGYAGINERYFKDGFYYLKPLLTFKKEKLINYARLHHIKYFEDVSNVSDDYFRNRIRNYLLPLLKEEDEFPFAKVIQYNNTLTKTFNYLRKTTKEFLGNSEKIVIEDFSLLDEVIQEDVICYLLEKEKFDFNQNKITDLINFINGAGPNASYSLSNEKEFIKEYSVAFIRSKVAIISFQQKLDLKAFNVLPNGVFIEFSEEFNFEDGFIINLCYNKNALPLIARTRREGDLLYFNYGHKKLKDFYIDEKVPLIKRNKDIIITDNKGEILVVLGRYLNNKATLTSTIQLKYGGKVSE